MNYTKWKIDRHAEIDSSNRIVLRISTEFELSKENINQLIKRISKTDEMYEALKDISERAQRCRRILKSNKYTKGEWNILNTEKIESLLKKIES